MAKKLGAEVLPDSPEAIEAKLSEMETRLDRLKNAYEMYFMGMDKMEPSTLRRDMNRLMLETQQMNIRKATLRFRFQTMLQRWSLLTTYWNRTMREIEAGTYRRDLEKLQRRMAEKGRKLTETDAIAIGIPSHRAGAFAESHNRRMKMRGILKEDDAATPGPTTEVERTGPVGKPVPAATAAEIAAREVVPGMTEADVVVLFDRWQEAARRTGDERAPANLAQLKQVIRKQAPKIMQDHMAFGVTFDVAIKDGRVILKAKPLR